MVTALENPALDTPAAPDRQWPVTVLMITYNHENFVAQAIESVMEQQTSFDFQLIIGEDCSRDRTREICLEYKERYPDKITLILNEKNLGVAANASQLHRICHERSSGYITILEGDDFWCDPLKLQKQYDLMERLPDVSFCFHRCNRLFDSGAKEATNQDDREGRFPMSEIIRRNWFIMTCSLMMRKTMYELPEWFEGVAMNADYTLQLLCGSNGDGYFLEDDMAVYRIHAGGVSQSMLKMEFGSNALCRMIDTFDRHTRKKYTALLAAKKRLIYDRVVEEFAYQILKSRPLQRSYWQDYLRIWKYSNFGNPMHRKYLIRYLIINPVRQQKTFC